MEEDRQKIPQNFWMSYELKPEYESVNMKKIIGINWSTPPNQN